METILVAEFDRVTEVLRIFINYDKTGETEPGEPLCTCNNVGSFQKAHALLKRLNWKITKSNWKKLGYGLYVTDIVRV